LPEQSKHPWSFPPLAATLNKVLKSYAPGRFTARAFLFAMEFMNSIVRSMMSMRMRMTLLPEEALGRSHT
jgi:hypothetical protein